MSNDTEFREELDRVVRRNDPSPEELRSAAQTLEQYAAKWEALEDV